MNTTLRTRLFSLAAAALTTALIAGSQLGLGQHYTNQADATMAAATKPAVAQVTMREGRPG
ncbi:MAG: hypothetical protein ACOVQT_16845 [Rubrivivax sp.]